jgi:hypothetical protein
MEMSDPGMLFLVPPSLASRYAVEYQHRLAENPLILRPRLCLAKHRYLSSPKDPLEIGSVDLAQFS